MKTNLKVKIKKIANLIKNNIKKIIILIIIFTYPSYTWADSYSTEIYSKDATHIIYQFDATGDSKKFRNTVEMMMKDARIYCSNYDKNFYMFKGKKEGKTFFDRTYKTNLFSATNLHRFICAKNLAEAENLVHRLIKNFRSPLYNVKYLETTSHNDPVLLDRVKVSDNHKDITRDEIIKKYFKGKKLENIEGIWLRKKESSTKAEDDDGTIVYIYKDSKNKFISRYYKVSYAKKGQIESTIEKISSKYFIAKAYHSARGDHFADTEYLYSKEGFFYESVKYKNGSKYDYKLFRIYPESSSVNSNVSGKTEYSGTAFFITRDGYLLTNHHVVNGCSISKLSYKNKEYETNLIATDKTLDLALLKANMRPENYIEFSSSDPKKLQKIFVAGYPLGKGLSDDLKITSGIVSSLKGFKDNSNEIQVDAAINPGNSGGPIVNESGELVAIAVSGLSKKLTESINFGIKADAARTFLKTNKVSPSISRLSFSNNSDKLLKILEDSTVYTYCNK